MTTAPIYQLQLPAGFTVRPVEPDVDYRAIFDLCAAAAMADYGTSDVTLQVIRESYNSVGFDAATDTALVVDVDGKPAGLVEYYDETAQHIAPSVFLRLRPGLEDTAIGEELLKWAESRGQRGLALVPEGVGVTLHTDVAGANVSLHRILEKTGWQLTRVSWTMEVQLADEPWDAVVFPDGIHVRTTVAGVDERAIHAAEQEAFAQQVGYPPRSFESWLQLMTEFFPCDPNLWFLAMDGDEIAGISLCRQEMLGRPGVGWLGVLAVRPAWRGRGLGRALLRHSFRELHRRGQLVVGLTVDSQNTTGATRLFERAGMRVVRDTREYERIIRESLDVRPT